MDTIPIDNNYVSKAWTEENRNTDDKYSVTGESEFSRKTTHPLDEVLSERHYNFGSVNLFNRDRFADRPNHQGRGPKGYKRSDERIREDVCEALFASSEVDASDIEVTVISGHVHLKGMVDSREAKKNAEWLSEKIYGVYDIHNELKIQHHGNPLVGSWTGIA